MSTRTIEAAGFDDIVLPEGMNHGTPAFDTRAIRTSLETKTLAH